MEMIAKKTKIYLALLAFLVTWALGLLAGVSEFTVLTRALIAAAVFGLLGHAFGRVVSGTLEQELAAHEEKLRTAAQGGRVSPQAAGASLAGRQTASE